MLRSESNHHTRAFSKNLSRTLRSCADDVDELRRTFERGHIGRVEDAEQVVREMQSDMNSLKQQVQFLTGLKNAVSAEELLTAAQQQFLLVERVMDAFESRVEESYGIKPVSVEEIAPKDVLKENISSSNVHGDSLDKEDTYGGYDSPEADRRESSPKTPRLEDFGISDIDIAALSNMDSFAPSCNVTTMDNGRSEGIDVASIGHSGSYGMAAASTYSSGTGAAAIMEGDGRNYEDVVAKSMQDLGIETPIDLAARYEQRRRVAMQGVMQQSTPRMRGGGSEHTLDYTGLAHGYSASGVRDTGRRVLNFDDMSMVEDGVGLRERVAQMYDRGNGAWKGLVGEDQIYDAVQALEGDGGRSFAKDGLIELLEGCVGRRSAKTCLMALTDLKVLDADKQYGQEVVYRYRKLGA